MLAHLSISNYTIVDQLDMEFAPGMTVLTGETGAGKSILLDALGLCLGDRADPKAVRVGCERAEISATFEIGQLQNVQHWLQTRDLNAGEECILRRTITSEGRSRAFVNGHSCTLQDCSQLGELLVDIHSQHAHQSLLRREIQRHLLDEFAGQTGSAGELEGIASDWLRRWRKLEELSGANEERSAKTQLLAYQVGELDTLALGEGEVAALEAEQKLLANAEHILNSVQEAIALCDEQEQGSRRALQLLQDDVLSGSAIQTSQELIDSAAIQLEEAKSELRGYLDKVEIDPARLRDIEARLDTVFDIARKHRVRGEELPAMHQQLRDELAQLEAGDSSIEALKVELATLGEQYLAAARRLSKKRQKAATRLTGLVEKQLAELAMEQCRLEIALTPRSADNPHPHGLEDIEFLISTNPGQQPQALGKIASGGELSRISLAIQVITASTSTVPSMVFDEVDVGIGGAVAEVVGRLLRAMASQAQILCVTHLPQVASQGHQHLQVAKSADGNSATASLSQLAVDARVEEIARMLGGIKITDQTRAHAKEMLESVSP